jgi:hypothetical protein
VVDVTAEVEREVLLELVDVREVARLAGLSKLLERGVRPGHVRLVVLAVMKLHDLAADVRFERGVVVGEVGQGVLRHVLFFLSARRRRTPALRG